MDQNIGSGSGGPGGGGGPGITGDSREAEAARRIQLEAEQAKAKLKTEPPTPPEKPEGPEPVKPVDIQKMLEFFSTAIGRALGDHWELGPNESEYYAEVIAKQGPDFLKAFNPRLLFWVATALIVIPRLYETGVLIIERIKKNRETPPAEEPTKGAENAAIEFPEPRGPRSPRQPVDLAKGQGQRSDEKVPES